MTVTLTHFHYAIIRNWNCAHTMACEAYRRRDMATVNAVIEAMQIRAAGNNADRQAAVEKELEHCIEVREILAGESK